MDSSYTFIGLRLFARTLSFQPTRDASKHSVQHNMVTHSKIKRSIAQFWKGDGAIQREWYFVAIRIVAMSAYEGIATPISCHCTEYW